MPGNGEHRIGRQPLDQLDSGHGRAAVGVDSKAVSSNQGMESLRDANPVVRGFTNAFEEEPDPALPVTFGAYCRQPGVVLLLRASEGDADVFRARNSCESVVPCPVVNESIVSQSA